MKNFDWTQFTRKIAIEAPMQKIYDAWTIPQQLERWFLSDASFFTSGGNKKNKSQTVQPDDSYSWCWFLWDGTEKGTVLDVNGTDKIQFTFAGECVVTVTLRPYETGTIVTLHQENIPTTDEAKKNIRLGCDQGWSFYLVNLKSIYEGGLDLRNKNPKVAGMLNT